jgi:L-lactate dehydrogenase (cytochrome)
VKAATKGSVWYQLYLLGGRSTAEAGIDRARRAGYSALVFTIDTPVAGMRERDSRNGMKQMLGTSPFAKLPFLLNILAHPRWLSAFLADGGMSKLENIVIPGQGPMELIDVSAALAEAAVCWNDLKWIRNVWNGPIIVKGILTADDARRAVDEGAAAVIVSNHGGRQLDSVYPTIRALPEIVAAVNGRTEILMDGGIRRGADIVKAICLGARAVLIGRAYAYGMAAAGYPGIMRALEILRADVDRTLRLLGCPSIAALDSSYIDAPRHWRR